MKIKKHCNCPGMAFTQDNYEAMIFEAIQLANQFNHERSIIKKQSIITHVDSRVAEGFQILGVVKVGLTAVNQVQYEQFGNI